MQIEIVSAAGVRVLRLRGEFERLVIDDLRLAFASAPADGDLWVVLNLAGVSFIDSSSLNFLLRARKRAESAGGDIVLAEASDFVRSILCTLGIEAIFQQFETEADALLQLGGGTSA